MVLQGHDTMLPVTLDDMIYYSQYVARGCMRTLIVVDMPFMTYEANREQALVNAGRLMQEGHTHVVKLKGGASVVDTVRFLTERGVPMCGHLGLTPQSVHQLGGFRVQGRDAASAERIRDDARALQRALG